MKNRIVAILLCVLMLIITAVGCNEKEPTTSSKEQNPSSQSDISAGSQDEVTSSDLVSSDDFTSSQDDFTSSQDDYTSSQEDYISSQDTQLPSNTESTESTSSVVSDRGDPIRVPVKKPTESTPVEPAKTLYVKDFGAVGDGKTDDGAAILAAVSALRECSPGSKLVFESNKTYYYKNNGTTVNIVFYFEEDEGLTVQGNNTTILLGGYKNSYARMHNCKDMAIKGFNFDYAEYKPAFSAKVESVDVATGTAILIADRSINLETGETYFKERASGWFGVVASQASRHHMYILKYQMLDAEKRRVKVYFDMSDGNTKNRLGQAYVKKSGLVMPMPRSGNLIERGFSIHEVDGFTMKDCNVYSYSRHGMSLQFNTGKMLFENVKNVPAPYDKDLQYTGWGDFYHVINSSGAEYKFVNCENKYNYDDVFNFSAGTLELTSINSKRDIVISERENGFNGVKAGATLVIINTSTGELVYRDAIKSVVKIDETSARIRLEKEMKGASIGEEVMVWIEDAAGKMELINCKMVGTFRTRANTTFTNCELGVMRFWLGLESQAHEGPLPRNVLFKNCKFDCVDTEVFEIYSFCPVNSGYHIENVVFDGCTGIANKHIIKGPSDEVIIK